MTVGDARAFGSNLVARLKKLPLPALLAAGTIALFALVMTFVGFSGPRYSVLFDGLSPPRGGQVIAALQKEGIPYKLSQSGNVISVPASDLGRARLQLGADGQPDTGSSSSWKALESATMTTSEAATRALHLQAVEHSLQESIETLSGARKVQVLLAEPKNTPFLANQPEPKASVVLTGAPQADESLGIAIAQIVAGAVPGLNKTGVVVATNGGTVIYPESDTGGIAQQIAIRQRIEAAQEAKIRDLLVPILGPGNFRIAVSANVAFATKTVHSITYGPKTFAVSADEQSQNHVGGDKAPIGIPGALSNQPPGPTTAPLNSPKQGKSGTTGGQAAGTKSSTKGNQKQVPPESESKKTDTKFAVDETSLTARPASWAVNKINATVVVNKAALGSLSTSALKAMILSTIAVSGGQVDVTSASFVTPGPTMAAPPRPRITRIIQAVLLVIAASAFLFGAILPLTRWLRGLMIEHPSPQPAPRVPDLDTGQDPAADNLRQMTEQVTDIGRRRPEAMARVLQQWIQTEKGE